MSVCPVCNFGVLLPNGWIDQDEASHAGRPRLWPHRVSWGPSSPPPKGQSPPPQYSAHFYCGQTAGCIKMPLGIEVGLSPGDFVLDGDRGSLPKNGAEPPSNFRPCLLWPNGWMDQDGMALGMEVGLGSTGHIVLDGNSAQLPKKGQSPPPNFRPILFWANGWMHQDAT